ncbi:SPOR domain-containing protein [Sphingopyxis indica]|uniref:Sel1 repeat-containing protein n=1 Tax=Sphingopyxis indica TaxID=436663 RepID=A0A239DQI4_9SPHN|nr:SPOR domain-containing protein [Sphingopyxis indica]SNS34776.1 Sel1 repeat-containing protein [Sphingopyxis indica]
MRSFRTASFMLSAAAAAALAAPALADVKAGVDAWQKGDYQSAVAEWRPLALAGDPDAQFNLGQAYKLGRGVPADLAQAESWYRRAAKQGHLQAEDNLGLVLFTAGRRQEAMPYIEASAARGEPRAQYVLGTAHFNGDLAAENWPLAYALTKRASDAGLQIASARLAQLDGLIPLEQRQRGLAMLPEMEKSEQRARLAATAAATPAAPKPASSAIKPVPVAPSAPLSPAAQAAADAASEATAAAKVASADAAKPATPGTSYPAPPASGPLPAKSAPVQTPVPTAAAPAKVATNAPASPWRAQLGAFGVEANARNLWKRLAAKYPSVASREPLLVKSAKLTRLQAGGFAGKAQAVDFCATMQKGGQPCLVVDK